MYTPLLKEIDLTYTQYIVMMVMWEKKTVTVGEIGKILYLDTGTLSPLLKSMEKKSLIKRQRNSLDERIVEISITEEGEKLKEKADGILAGMADALHEGRIEAVPSYGGNYKHVCDYCDYKAVCSYEDNIPQRVLLDDDLKTVLENLEKGDDADEMDNGSAESD